MLMIAGEAVRKLSLVGAELKLVTTMIEREWWM
jgi:hypothetical protein